MIESLILGAVQGIVEWLPISSEGFVIFIKNTFFGGGDLDSLVRFSLFLHLGTFLAALIYFRVEVWKIIKTIFRWREENEEYKKTASFLFVSTLITALVGMFLLQIVDTLFINPMIINFTIAFLLLGTGLLQLKSKDGGVKVERDLKTTDSVLLGLVQSIATLPGLSRSGLTVSTLLLRGFDKESALRISFLMSLPIVLGGNIVLNFNEFVGFSFEGLIALLASLIFGWLTIDILLKIAKRVNFGYFVIFFAVLVFIAGFFV
jgi:undecaprenyl-diphosphatase